MQTPSILQQITPPNSQVKKNSEFNDASRFNSNTESSSSFKKILTNEVGNQNKINSSNIKNDSTNINKNQKIVKSNETNEDEKNEDNLTSLSNQNILIFVEDIEQLKEIKSDIKSDKNNNETIDAENNTSSFSDSKQVDQALTPVFQIKIDNIEAPPDSTDAKNSKDISILKKSIELTDQSILSQNEENTSSTLISELEATEKNDIVEKPISDVVSKPDFSGNSKYDKMTLEGAIQSISTKNKDTEINRNLVSLNTQLTNTKELKNESNADIKMPKEFIVKSSPDLSNKLNAESKIELHPNVETPPIDFKDVSANNSFPKIDTHFTHSIGLAPEQLKASGLANYIPAQLGTKAWDQAIGQRIVWMIAGGEQSAQLTLNPPDLGPLQVVLKISDNQVDASFISSHLDVRDTLESAMPKLRQMMDDAGIQLSGFSVNSQASQSGQNFTQENSSNKTNFKDASQDVNLTSIDKSMPKIIKNEIGLVDTFV